MGTFWLIAIAMALLAGALIGVPLRRRPPVAEVSREAVNAAIFRERLAELDAEFQEGRLNDERYRQLHAELERTLLVDIPEDAERPAIGDFRLVRLGWSAALAMPLLVLGYYYFSVYRGEVNDWIVLQQRLEGAVERTLHRFAEMPAEAQADLPGFTRVLQAHLLREGMNDVDGLLLLGNSYLELQHLPEALTALDRAYELAPQRPDIALAYAQAMILTRDQRLSETGARLLHNVLQFNPNHQGALMLLGLGAFNSGAYAEAIRVWRQLLALQEPDSEGARLLHNSIHRAEQLLAARQEPAIPEGGSAPAPTRIAVTVDLAPALRMRLSPQDTLFIFAKAVDGPPMPLAAIRQQAQNFPVQLMLDDSQAVTPSLKLSNYQRVIVSARISKAGNATPQPGDLQGNPAVLSLQAGMQSVSLVIDQVVQ